MFSRLNSDHASDVRSASSPTRSHNWQPAGNAHQHERGLWRALPDTTRNGMMSSSASKQVTCMAIRRHRSANQRGQGCVLADNCHARKRDQFGRGREAERFRLAAAARAATPSGCFLPYAFAGLALGGRIIDRSVYDAVISGSPFAPLAWTTRRAKHNHLVYGYSAGVGVDMMLVGGLFCAGEYEYRRVHVGDRNQREHGARRPRLQVLIWPASTGRR